MTLAPSPPPEMIEHPTEHLVRSLATSVEGALWRFDPIRQTRTMIAVTDSGGGAVRLTGNIRGEMMKAVATRLARQVPGVTSVDNRLVADPELEREIAVRLAMDPDAGVTTDLVSVRAILGRVVLSGRVFGETQAESDALLERVAAIAAAVPGVVALDNEVVAVEGLESAFVVSADVASTEGAAPKAKGERNMGTLLPDALKDRFRAMIKARAETRAQAGGEASA
jgi:osmotically-inducible protein OsmY